MISRSEPSSSGRVWAGSADIDLFGVTHLYGFVDPREWNGSVWFAPQFNVVMVDGVDGGLVALVSVDAIYANEIYRLANRALKDTKVVLLMAASHSHYTTSYAEDFPVMGHAAAQHVQRAGDTLVQVVRRGIDEIGQAEPSLFGSAEGEYYVARRRRRGLTRRHPKLPLAIDWIMQPESQHHCPERLRVWRIEGANVPVVVWSFACHPTGFFDHHAVSSEFPGRVRDELRSLFGEECVVLFLQGASGDLRQPFMSRDPRRVGWLPYLLAFHPRLLPTFVRPSQSEWSNWSDGLADEVARLATKAAPSSLMSQVRLHSEALSVNAVIDGPHPVAELCAYSVDFGAGFRLACVNAEVTSRLWGQIKEDEAVPVTCTNECLGYLASDIELEQGGYESRTWLRHFGCAGSIRLESSSVFVDLVERALLGGSASEHTNHG